MCPIARSLERSMFGLDSNTSESDFWLLLVCWLLSSDLGAGVLGKINEDLSVKHAVFVQVENLWSSALLSLLNLALLDLFFLLFVPLFGKFLLPRLLHLFHGQLILTHLLLGFF